MIISTPAFVARLLPTAYFAMRIRLGIGFFTLPFERRQKPTLHLPEKSSVIGKAVRARLKVRPGCDNMHVLGYGALRLAQQVGIEAKLKHGSGFCFARELSGRASAS
jgi:hypothetical protein